MSLLLSLELSAQSFVCQANKYLTVRSGNLSKMYEILIDPLTGVANFEALPTPNVGVSLNAIGYRSSDNYIYGLDVQSKDLIRINANGGGELIGNIPDLPSQYNYYGADCTADGNFLVLIGSTTDSKVLVYVNLADLNNPPETVFLISPDIFYSTDIAFHPIDGLLYGFDQISNRILSIETDTGVVDFKNYPSSMTCDAMGAVFFDSFGTFYGYGNELNALDARALFRANLQDGLVEKIASGPSTIGKDACSCPYTVELQKEVIPRIAFPCTTVEYIFTLSNLTDKVQTGIDLYDAFPTGLSLQSTAIELFGGQLNSQIGDDFLFIEGMMLPPGIHKISIQVYVDESVSGLKKNQAILSGLPMQLGGEQLSDDPLTGASTDSTELFIQPLFVDLQYDTFTFCQSEELLLDATTFGSAYSWQDGSTEATFLATTPGDYAVTVSSACDFVIDSVHITSQEITIVENGSVAIDLGASVQLNPIIISNVDYDLSWTDPLGNSLSCLQCASPNAQPTSNVLYPFSILSNNAACNLSGTIAVEVIADRSIYIPNVFSPDDNGNNDHWQIFSRQPSRITELRIFSRWGEEVTFYSSTDFQKIHRIWNGKLNERIMQPAVFAWRATLQFLDGHEEARAGELTLLR